MSKGKTLESIETSEKGSLETKRIIIPPKQSKVRLDVFLTHQVENATRSKMQKAITDGFVLVNGKVVKPSHLIAPNEIIDVTFPRPPRSKAQPEEIPLDIIYEDDAIIVVNKPAGMVTHPAYGNYSGTLVNALLHHCNHLSTVNTEMRPGIIHRLDKETSGLMVVAKTDSAHTFIARQFSKRTIERAYWAIVWGLFKTKSGIIDASLARSKRDRKKITVAEEGKIAITEYEIIEQFEFLSLLKLKPKTGRTHQIRVHLAHIGRPVFGDPAYAGRSSSWGGLKGKKEQQAANLLKMIGRQALHAKTLGFVHPTSKELVHFESPLPKDIRSVLNAISV